MTRIFEALRKSRPRAALPFPPPEPGPLRPLAAAAPAESPEPVLAPRLETIACAPLPDELARQMAGLRVGLESSLEGRGRRVVMFLSSMGREGATTVALQFAISLAREAQGPALLLDANARNPGLAARLGLGRTSAPGPGQTPAGAALLTAADLTGELLRAGSRGPASLGRYLATVSGQFAWVVVDGPPVLEAPQAAILAPYADGVVIVVRSGSTKRPVVVRAVELLRKSGARILGSVLSRRRLEIPDFIYRRL